MLYTANVNNGVNINVVQGAYDSYKEGLVYMSGFGTSNVVKQVVRDTKKKCDIKMAYRRFTEAANTLSSVVNHVPESEYSHIILYKKDQIYSGGGKERLKLFIFIQREENDGFSDLYSSVRNTCPEKLITAVYDKLYKMCAVPILKDWMPYLLSYFVNEGFLREITTISSEGMQPIFCGVLDIAIEDIVTRLEFGLQNGNITIGQGGTSDFMKDVKGIDAYLSQYSEVLTKKIQRSFVPMFIPQQDSYCDDLSVVYDWMKYNDHISLYPAQTDVAQAITNVFAEGKKCCFVAAECGAGKTALAITAANSSYGSFQKNKPTSFMNNIVMCPSHLVHMWKREIENRSPRSKAVIVKDIAQLISLEPLLKREKRRRYHLWIIVSKETAKFGFELRPSVVWAPHRKVPGENKHGLFCCPKCGRPLFYTTKEGKGRYRRAVRHYLVEDSFRTESLKKNNVRCENTIQVWDEKEHIWTTQTCGEPLWGPATKDTIYDGVHEDRWVKLPRQGGWMQRRHLRQVYDRLVAQTSHTNEETKFMAAIADELKDEGLVQRAPRKYPIATYIRKRLKGIFDYVLLDEVHELKGKDSLQGEAMGDIIASGKRVIALTGTLINGYCSGIFYLLYKLFPGKMKTEGYDYKDCQSFASDYGVLQKTQTYDMRNSYGHTSASALNTQQKELPGISPIVFTKFLLENAAFISLEDIADALPNYEEIPIPLDMPEDLHSAYGVLTEAARNTLGRNQKSSVASQVIQLLSVFPDQPYDQPSVYNPENGDVVVTPPELSNEARTKENALLSLCQEKVAAGEHVLVYYSWTNRTDVNKRLPAYLESYGIKTAVLTTSVKSEDREAWIQQKVKDGVQVLFCNPTLVETGLSLLDFTTIIWYQVCYNLYTMRQASRRSWRINQDHDVQVYFLYYKDTVQEQALSLMATKLQAAMAIEGKFSEEGLNAMSNNEDILTQIAMAVTEDIKDTVDVQVFQKHVTRKKKQGICTNVTENTVTEMSALPVLKPFPKVTTKDLPDDLSDETKQLLTSITDKIQN